MKLGRFLMVALALFCGLNACAEELLCVNTDELATLLTVDGEEVISPGIYEQIFCVVPGEVYAVGNPSETDLLYSLCDAEGNLLTNAPMAMYDADGDDILFRDGLLYGAMDRSGNIIISAEYTQLVSNGHGGFYALSTDPMDDHADEVLYINEFGEVLPSGIYTAEKLRPVADDRMAFRSPDREEYGYLDASGGVAIEARLSYAGDFENGMATAAEDGLWGVLSPAGEWLIAPEYAYLEIGKDLILGLREEALCVVWDRATCAELFRCEGENLNVVLLGDKALVMDDDVISVYDREGALFLEAERSAMLTAGVGGQLILSDGDWGTACVSLIDSDGNALERRDQHLQPLDQHRYAFMTMNVAAYNSLELGEIRYSCDYDSIRYGMMNERGEEILPAMYLEILCVGSDRYLTKAYDGYRIVDGEGTVIWSCIDESMR